MSFDILAISLANPDEIFKIFPKILFFFLILSVFASDLAKKSGEDLLGVSGRFPQGQHFWFTRYSSFSFTKGKFDVYLL